MEYLANRLGALGLAAYLPSFEAHSFDSWPAVLDITEQDLIDLGVDLGHRRKLQRAIATERGLDTNAPLPTKQQNMSMSPSQVSTSIGTEDEGSASLGTSVPSNPSSFETDTSSQSRRKYKRRQKREPSRPERPLTGYVRFSRDRHKRYRHNQWTFAQLAKRIGEDWRDLDPEVKNEYLSVANEEWDVFRKVVEQEKLKRASEDCSPQATAYHHALMSINGSISQRDGITEPAIAANMSTFSILSPPQRNSHPSPGSSVKMHSPTSPNSATGSNLQYHSAFTALPSLMSAPQQSHPQTPLQGVSPAFTWPAYSVEVGMAAPQSAEGIHGYYPIAYSQHNGLFQPALHSDVAMLHPHRYDDQRLGGDVGLHSESSAATIQICGDGARPESRNAWSVSGPRNFALPPSTPDSTDCHARLASGLSTKPWDTG